MTCTGISPNPLRLSLLVVAWLLFPAILSAGQVQVTWVYDGDTVKGVENGKTVRIRLVGIDTPETSKKRGAPGQPYSKKARDRLKQLIGHRTVDVTPYGVDDYHRILGEIFVQAPEDLRTVTPDGGLLNVNLQMVREGLAEVYGGKLPARFDPAPYKRAEAKARQSSRGMWQQGENYVPPWKWKRQHRRD